MKFTLSWLFDYLETNASLEEICDTLNNIGLEVESAENKAKDFELFRVAHIIATEPHPDSQKLQICQIDVGKPNTLQVICGAKNARKGLKVAFAPIGSIIPTNQMKIKKAKIAGVESCGMICSAAELGLGQDEEGIIEINPEIAIGTQIADVFGLNETVIDVNITPNRGDCLGIYGIARDLAAAGLGNLKSLEVKTINGNLISPIKTEIKTENCIYFSGFYIENVTNKESPKWLKDKIEAVGINSISAIVDITNYVMISLGQPLHSYDADKINGNIIVRNATLGENFQSLKEQDYKLTGGELVIADNTGIISLGGIIGGQNSATNSNTKNIFLESAFFKPEIIAKTGRDLNILSDARYRFERNVDLEMVKNSLETAANLIIEICGGNISNIVEVGVNKDSPREIELNLNDIKKILGIEIEKSFVLKTLNNLGFQIIKDNHNILNILTPSYRSDVSITQDLIEEIIRIYGYNKISSNCLDNFNIKAPALEPLELIRNRLCNSGLIEVINWSFINKKTAKLFNEIQDELILANPISVQMNYMRPNLLVGLLQLTSKNQARNINNIAISEIGKIFLGVDEKSQQNVISSLRIGKNKTPNHYQDMRDFDVFDAKKDLFDCLETLGFSEYSFKIESHNLPNYYHPHKSASIKLGKNIVGYFGEIHPNISKALSIKGKANVFELFFDHLPLKNKNATNNKPFIVSDLQAVNRDFAFILDQEIASGDLLKAVSLVDKNLITKVNIFDIYQGDKLDDGKKSIAFSVTIQPNDKTLTGAEIEQISDKIIQKVSIDFSGLLRDH